MKILVTGGAGFIGHNLIRRLVKEDYEITSLDDYSSGKKSNHIDGVHYVEGPTHEISQHLDSKFDVIFHLGEYSRIATSFDDIRKVWYSNSLGTFEVLEYAYKYAETTKIIYAGSSTRFAEEGVNHSPYSFTKGKSAEMIKNYSDWFGLDYAICYFYNVFGDGYDSSPVAGYESVVSVFEKQYMKGEYLTVCGNGHQRRAFTYVEDIVDGLLKAWKYPENKEFQLNNPKEYSILEIAKMFSDDIKFIPERKGDRSTSITTNNNARELLGWETTMDITDWIKRIKG